MNSRFESKFVNLYTRLQMLHLMHETNQTLTEIAVAANDMESLHDLYHQDQELHSKLAVAEFRFSLLSVYPKIDAVNQNKIENIQANRLSQYELVYLLVTIFESAFKNIDLDASGSDLSSEGEYVNLSDQEQYLSSSSDVDESSSTSYSSVLSSSSSSSLSSSDESDAEASEFSGISLSSSDSDSDFAISFTNQVRSRRRFGIFSSSESDSDDDKQEASPLLLRRASH